MRGFENEADYSKLNMDLGRSAAAKGKQWPRVVPSPEVFGAVAGWRVEPLQPSIEGAPPNTIDRIEDRNVYEAYRCQFAPLHERATALEIRTDEMVDALTQTYGHLANGMSFGRICPEVDANRINKASVMLELQGAINEEAAHAGRLNLDLRETASYSVFSGQIVGVKGVSIRDGSLNVTEIASRAPPPPVRIRKNNAEAIAAAQSGSGPLRIIAASGPFTAPNNLAFEPLQLLLAEAMEKSVDVLILQGPFFDTEHESVRTMVSTLDEDDKTKGPEAECERVWNDLICQLLDLYMSEEGSSFEVVIQPSPHDVMCEPVFPQWPLSTALLKRLTPEVRGRITMVPNPASIVIGDMLWCMTTAGACLRPFTAILRCLSPSHHVPHAHDPIPLPCADPVFGINTDDATYAPTDPDIKDRYTFLARHVLDQRSFYPLFPPYMPPINTTLPASQGEAQQATRAVPLDVTKLWNLGLPACPDVLLLPSKLGMPQGRAMGHHTVLVHPGQLASKKSYAQVRTATRLQRSRWYGCNFFLFSPSYAGADLS